MTKVHITNLETLRLEKRRLEELSIQQKQQLKADIAAIKEQLEPINILINTIARFTGITFDKKALVGNGISYGLTQIFHYYFSKVEEKAEDKLKQWFSQLISRLSNWVKNGRNDSEPSATTPHESN